MPMVANPKPGNSPKGGGNHPGSDHPVHLVQTGRRRRFIGAPHRSQKVPARHQHDHAGVRLIGQITLLAAIAAIRVISPRLTSVTALHSSGRIVPVRLGHCPGSSIAFTTALPQGTELLPVCLSPFLRCSALIRIKSRCAKC